MKHRRAIACAVFFTALPLLTMGCATQANAIAELQGRPVFFRLMPCDPPYPENQYQINPQPHWYMPPTRLVGEDEYHAWLASRRASGEVFEVQAPASVDGRYPIPDPLPYPESIDDLPANDRGVELFLSAQQVMLRDDPRGDVLKARLTLSTESLAILKHVMHRYGVDPPVLFAVYFDGVAWEGERTGFGMMGGIDWMDGENPIAEPHHPKTWRFEMNLYPFWDLVPDDVDEVTLVAVYAERLPVGYVPGPGLQLPVLATNYTSGLDRPIVLVRSNPVTLRLRSD